jgi:outer membrane protein TolC
VEASFGLKRTNGINTLMGIVQLPIPLLNRNEGAIAASTAEIRMAQSELAAANALVEAEVRSAATEVTMRRRQVTETFRGLLDRAAESSRIARAAYREGGWDLLRLLDAERSRIELQVLYFRTLSEYHQSVVALETAMGVSP